MFATASPNKSLCESCAPRKAYLDSGGVIPVRPLVPDKILSPKPMLKKEIGVSCVDPGLGVSQDVTLPLCTQP